MGRVKITGYFTPDEGDADPTDHTGLTEAAYLRLVAGESGIPLKVYELEDIEVERG